LNALLALIALELFLSGGLAPVGVVPATAYCLAEQPMYSGMPVHDGAAACGPAWELGTVVYLEGGRVVRCLDRGGGLSALHVDVWMADCGNALVFGRQDLRAWALR
jgi:3D (Asp-Asp-Asp) domain-containing protein